MSTWRCTCSFATCTPSAASGRHALSEHSSCRRPVVARSQRPCNGASRTADRLRSGTSTELATGRDSHSQLIAPCAAQPGRPPIDTCPSSLQSKAVGAILAAGLTAAIACQPPAFAVELTRHAPTLQMVHGPFGYITSHHATGAA
jgi:hypothetical protein